MGLLREEQALARRMVAGLEPGQAQAVLDELSGRMASATPPRNPLSYLRGLADRAQADSFLPELASRVAQQREPRDEVTGLHGLGSRMVGSGLPSGEAVEAPGSTQGSSATRLSNAGDTRQSGSTPPAASDTASHADPVVPDGSDGPAAQVSALQLRRAESMRQLRNLSLRLQALHGNLPLRGTRKERA